MPNSPVPTRDVTALEADAPATTGAGLERAERAGTPWWRPALQVPGAALWALGMLLGWYLAEPRPTPGVDTAILTALSHHRVGPLVTLGRWIEFWDGPKATPWLLLVVLVLVFLRGHRLLAVLAVTMTGLSWLPGHIAKTLFPRVRPPASLQPVFHVTGANSFPSGHTGFVTSAVVAGAFCLTTLGHRRARTWWVALGIALAVLVGLSRMYIAVHFPTDVLGGALLAGGMSLVLWPLFAGIFAAVARRWPSWTR